MAECLVSSILFAMTDIYELLDVACLIQPLDVRQSEQEVRRDKKRPERELLLRTLWTLLMRRIRLA